MNINRNELISGEATPANGEPANFRPLSADGTGRNDPGQRNHVSGSKKPSIVPGPIQKHNDFILRWMKKGKDRERKGQQPRPIFPDPKANKADPNDLSCFGTGIKT